VEGIWKVTEPATEGLSLLKLGARLERGELMSPVSDRVCRCISKFVRFMGSAWKEFVVAMVVLRARVALKVFIQERWADMQGHRRSSESGASRIQKEEKPRQQAIVWRGVRL
jgi:hypothetical protein